MGSSSSITFCAMASSRSTSACTDRCTADDVELTHREQLELDALERVMEPFARHPNRPVTYASVRSSAGFVKIVSVRSNSTTVPVR